MPSLPRSSHKKKAIFNLSNMEWTKDWGKSNPKIGKQVVQEHLAALNEFKSPGPDQLHPRVLKELAEVISEPLAIIFESSWRMGEVPADWRSANVVPIFNVVPAQLHLHNRFEILTSLTYNQETHLVEDHSFLDTTQWTILDQCAGDSPDRDSASPQSHLCNHANAPSPIIDQEQQEHPWESNGLSDVSQWIVIDECTGDVEEEDNTLHLHDSLQQEHSSGDIHTVLHKRDPVNPQRKQVLVVGDSLLRGTEAIISRPDGMARETCCLPGAKIHHITQRLSRLLKPHHPPHLMLIHVGTNDTARHTFQKITNDFRALGTKLKLYNVHVIFSSLLPVVGHGSTRAGKIVQVNNWLRKWCQEEHFGFLDHGLLFQEDGLLASDGVHLTQVGKHLFAHRLTNLIRRTLN
uniref:SGNH hydrolase-type esterase domain-containing protein n=1 Tax=Anolis carolinensis TaxID=28377 RepID=A0A803THE0_ANOCA